MPGTAARGELCPRAVPVDDTGASIIAGYVYRGTAVPSLQAAFFFADYYADTVSLVC